VLNYCVGEQLSARREEAQKFFGATRPDYFHGPVWASGIRTDDVLPFIA
jgi:hypothetical protein